MASSLMGNATTYTGATSTGATSTGATSDGATRVVSPAAPHTRIDESVYRAMFAHSSEAKLLLASSGRVLEANEAAGDLLLVDRSELIGRHCSTLFDDGDGRDHPRFRDGQRIGAFVGVVALRRSDRSHLWAEISSVEFRDSGGAVTGCVTLRDVTDRHETEAALSASEFRYRSLIESTGNVLVGVAPDGRIIEWNREAERCFGRSRREVLGRDYFALCVDDDRRDSMRADMGRAMASGALVHREDHIGSGDGQHRVVLWTVSRLMDAASRVVGVIASGQDITERKRIEAQVQHTQKLESLGVLAGGIAHDFNNLLAGILGNASLVLMDLGPDSALFELVKDIETTALRAADLTRQMLTYSGRGRTLVCPLDVSALVEEMAHLLHTVISKRAVLHFDFEPEMPKVEADATRLGQIVMNLIVNASDALNGANGEITLRTGMVVADAEYLRSPYLDYEPDEGPYAFVEVSDNGSGMSPDTMRRVFDPFFSTKFTGRGLGLAATLGIVRGHRGSIKLTSALGHGTTFRVLLPVSPVLDHLPRAEESQAVPACERAGAGGPPPNDL